jgi:hypothetical protein
MFAVVKRASLLGALLLLILPAMAPAATTTVDAASGGGCQSAGTCKSISQAVNVSKAGDTIVIKKGTFVEDVAVPEDKTGLTFKGDPGSVLRGTFTTAAADARIAGLTVYPTAGDSAVTAAGKLTLTDVVVLAPGTVLTLNGGSGSRIQRSTLVSSNTSSQTADGVKQAATDLTVDSSIVVGGTRGAAFRVTTTNGSPNAALALNHVTTVTPGIGIVLLGQSADSLDLNKVGDIALTVSSSIIHGASAAVSDPGFSVLGVPVRPANAVTATFTNSDASKFGGADGKQAPGSGTTTPNSALFSTPSGMRLKFGAPVIDKGGPLAAGESATDIDGDPRIGGAASDIGADEFTNHAPTLTLSVLPAMPHAGETVTASGRAVDREGSSDIAGFATDWGDGSPRSTMATGVAQHVYAKPGTYTVSMIVQDRSGVFSDVAQQSVTVTDGDPPLVRLTAPAAGKKVRLNSDWGHKQLTIRGVATDVSGIGAVEIALTKRGPKKKCLQYVGKTFGKGACDGLVFLPAVVSGDSFTLRTEKGVVIPTGSYQVRARAKDVLGNATTSFTKASRTLVKFKVR